MYGHEAEASQGKSRVLPLPAQHMEGTWHPTLISSINPSLCILPAVVWVGAICSDDGPKQSLSSLWTLVMRISCFLLQRRAITSIPKKVWAIIRLELCLLSLSAVKEDVL